jgi:hypothetical protein
MTTIKSAMACAMAFTLMACAGAIVATPDDMGIDQMIQRDIGLFSVDVREHSDSNCRRVFQTIEEIWYVACKDKNQLIVRMEDE